MAVAVTIADNASTTPGVVATVVGSSAGATNTLSHQRVTAGMNAVNWTAGASRTSDGTIALSLPVGAYWLKIDSVLGGAAVVSNLVLMGVTDGQTAVHERCITSIKSHIDTLLSTGVIKGIMSSSKCYDMSELGLADVDLPGIVVCTGVDGVTPTEQQVGGTNERDDIGYPTYVVLLDRSGGNFVEGRPGYLLARQTIFRYFRQQRLSGVAEVYICKPEPGPVLRYKPGEYLIMASVLILRHISREARG